MDPKNIKKKRIIKINEILNKSEIIWCEKDVSNKTNATNFNSLNSISTTHQFEDIESVINYLQDNQNNNNNISYDIIISGTLGEELIKKIDGLKNISRIFIFCFNKEKHQEWTKNYPDKIAAVETDWDQIISQLNSPIPKKKDPSERQDNSLPKSNVSDEAIIKAAKEKPSINQQSLHNPISSQASGSRQALYQEQQQPLSSPPSYLQHQPQQKYESSNFRENTRINPQNQAESPIITSNRGHSNGKWNILWCDSNMDNPENKSLMEELDKKYTLVKMKDISMAVEHLTTTKDLYIVIVSGRFGEELTKNIFQLTNIIGIIVFCGNKNHHLDWSQKFEPKMKCVTELSAEVLFMIEFTILAYVKNKESENFEEKEKPVSTNARQINKPPVKENTEKNFSKQKFEVVWHDPDNLSGENYSIRLNSLTKVHKFSEWEKAVEHIERNTSIPYFIITSGTNGLSLMNKIHDLPHIIGAYVFCVNVENVENNKKWAREFDKIVSVTMDYSEIFNYVRMKITKNDTQNILAPQIDNNPRQQTSNSIQQANNVRQQAINPRQQAGNSIIKDNSPVVKQPSNSRPQCNYIIPQVDNPVKNDNSPISNQPNNSISQPNQILLVDKPITKGDKSRQQINNTDMQLNKIKEPTKNRSIKIINESSSNSDIIIVDKHSPSNKMPNSQDIPNKPRIKISQEDVSSQNNNNAIKPTNTNTNNNNNEKSNKMIVWFDQTINQDYNIENMEFLEKLCSTKGFDNHKNAIEYIKTNNIIDYYVITSGSNGRSFVNEIHHLNNVKDICVYCGNREIHLDWSKHYNKIICVETNFDALLQQLKLKINVNNNSSSLLSSKPEKIENVTMGISEILLSPLKPFEELSSSPSFIPLFTESNIDLMRTYESKIDSLLKKANPNLDKSLNNNDPFISLCKKLKYIDIDKDYIKYVKDNNILEWFIYVPEFRNLINHCLNINLLKSGIEAINMKYIEDSSKYINNLNTTIKNSFEKSIENRLLYTGVTYSKLIMNVNEWNDIQKNHRKDLYMTGFIKAHINKNIGYFNDNSIMDNEENNDKIEILLTIIIPKTEHIFRTKGFAKLNDIVFNIMTRFEIMNIKTEKFNSKTYNNIILLYEGYSLRQKMQDHIYSRMLHVTSKNVLRKRCTKCQKEFSQKPKTCFGLINLKDQNIFHCSECYINKIIPDSLDIHIPFENYLQIINDSGSSPINGILVENIPIDLLNIECSICKKNNLNIHFKCQGCKDDNNNIWCVNCLNKRKCPVNVNHILIAQTTSLKLWVD